MGVIKKSILFIILGLLILSGLFVNVDNTENKIRIEKTRADIIVDINGNGDYISIQDAIDNANADDAVYVWKGTYYENVMIDKTITLIGNGSATTIINGTGYNDVVNITANGVNVTGFNISNSGSTWYDMGIEIYESNNCTISECKMTDNYYAIYLTHSNNNIIKNNNCSSNNCGIELYFSNYNEVTNNNCLNNTQSGIHMFFSDYNTITNNTNEYCDISMSSSKHNMITNNTNEFCDISLSYSDYNSIIDNNIANDSDYGVYLYYSDYNTIIDNNCSSDYGIYTEYSDHNTIMNNSCMNNDHHGISLLDSDFNIIINNSCTNNYIGICLVYSYHNMIENNNCSNNYHGISLWSESNNNTVIFNICSNNNCGIRLSYSNYNSITENRIENNVEYGIYLYESSNNEINNNHFANNGKDIYETELPKHDMWWDFFVAMTVSIIICIAIIIGYVYLHRKMQRRRLNKEYMEEDFEELEIHISKESKTVDTEEDEKNLEELK